MGKKWVPLESNPEVLNQFARTLGFDVSTYAFCDVLGLDEVRPASHGAAATSQSHVLYSRAGVLDSARSLVVCNRC
jgi:hypothetical protein